MTSDASWIDSMPEIYQSALGPALFDPYGSLLASKLAAMAPTQVLELAAGTGAATAQLVRALPDATIVATDLNAAMVEWGRQHVPERRLAGRRRPCTLSFDDGSYDAVVCQFGVMFFPDRPAAFAETARVLAPDGRFVFTTWDIVSASRFPYAMVESLEALLGSDAPNFLVRIPHGYHDPDLIRSDLAAGGLVTQTLERVVLRGRAADARTLARGFALGSPLRFALAELGPLDELVDRLGAEMTARLGEGPLEGDLTAWLAKARHQ